MELHHFAFEQVNQHVIILQCLRDGLSINAMKTDFVDMVIDGIQSAYKL
jgi:hypothetical protein